MTGHVLTTPREADELVARMFGSGCSCSISVREEKAFKDDGWLSLGNIRLDAGELDANHLSMAVKRGAFEWKLPELEEAQTELADLLGLKEQQKDSPKLRRALDAVAAISVRTGLQHPKFDPHALETMPFRRSATVVADTSGAIQGGLDFVARYLHPAARIKVPAIVQMEIVNFAERFLSGRRATKTKPPDLLIDHLMSQGGQRVLLRLELRADTEIERTFLLGDPLRSAFQRDNDPDLKDLNLNVTIAAYIDRMILEATRQHQAQSNLGHQVLLLTSDQGLARMALAEGIVPLFFKSVVAGDLFGKRLTGATLNPFSGQLCETSATSILWELATAFGSARLTNDDMTHSLVVSAFGEGLSWSPYQSHADLLWCDHSGVPEWPPSSPPERTPSIDAKTPNEKLKKTRPATTGRTPLKTHKATNAPLPVTEGTASAISFLKFNVGGIFNLVDALDNHQILTEDDVISTLGVQNRNGIEEQRRFLTSASLVTIDGRNWRAESQLQDLAIALRQEDVPSVLRVLLNAPSFALFARRIADIQPGQIWDTAELKRGANTYRTLGEVTCLCAPVHGEGLYSTPNTPDPAEFAPIALQRFRDLDQGDGLVATGAWLEELIRKNGIHPEIARNRLNDASAMNLLRRSTEGSTTEVRFDKHVIQVLRFRSGAPTVSVVHLYRGDYLIPGKSSTSLRIEGLDS